MSTKLLILSLLALSGLAIWMAPKFPGSRRFGLGDRPFTVMHLLGLVCGLAGLVATVVWPQAIMVSHAYELILLPVFAAYFVYPAMVARARRTSELYDERQELDMNRSAAWSLGATTVGMMLVYAFYREGALAGATWFPLYVFTVVATYSGCALYQNRRG